MYRNFCLSNPNIHVATSGCSYAHWHTDKLGYYPPRTSQPKVMQLPA